MAENTLLDLPVAIAAFHMDLTNPRIPGMYNNKIILIVKINRYDLF